MLFFIPTLFGWFSGNKEPEIIQAILKQEDDIKWALIVFAAMLFVLRKAENHMDNLWETTVSPVFKNIKKSLEEHISSVQKQATDRFANEFEEASRVLKSRNLIETMENTESEISGPET